MGIFYIDNEFVVEEQASLPVGDLAILRGYGVFDYLRTYNGHPFHLRDHIHRLKRSARLLAMELPKSTLEIEELVLETVKRNNYQESGIRIVVTGGSSDDGITPLASSRLLIMVTPAKGFAPELYQHGAKAICCHVSRFMPGAKSINYIPAILCKREAQQQGAVEALYLDEHGYIQEGTTSNFFAVKNGRLITPPTERLLPGITRQVVLELAHDMEVREAPVHKDEIRLLDEAFLTSSVKEVLPLAAMDSVALGQAPGPLTRTIMQRFAAYTKQYQG